MSSPSLNGDEPPPLQEGHAEPPVESSGEAESSTRGPPVSRVSFSTTTTNAKPTMRTTASSSNCASSSSSLSCKSSGTHLLADIASHLDVSIPVRDMIMNDPEAVAAQFDVSPFRLWLLFRSVDDNQDGFISKQELVRALSSTTTTNNSTTGADESDNPPSPRTEQMELLGNMTEEEDDDDESMEDVLPLQDMQALDELFDRIVCSAEKHNGELDVGTENGDGSCSAVDKTDSDKNDNENDDRDSSGDDQRTTQRRNVVPPSSTNSLPGANQVPPQQHEQQHQQPAADAIGISFPQFCRVIRYLWLQQLLNPKLDDETTSNNGKSGKNDPQQQLPPSLDPSSSNDNGYQFECVDYASGYYRHKTIFGHAGNHKRTRDFFTAPRHGRARMRWIDVPSGTFVQPAQLQQQQYSSHQPTLDQKYSFRMTILRLAVKYRFHPTSVEDAMDLEYQEPKVNSFEHALLDLGNFNCGTISWLRHAGALNTNNSAQESNENNGSRNGYEFTSSSTTNMHPNSSAQFGLNDSAVSMPRPRPAARASSTASFHSYHKESIPDNIPDFVMAEGEEDVNINEGRHYFITIPMFELSRRSQTSLDLYKEAANLLPFMQVQPLIIEVNEATLGIFVASLPDSNLVVTCSTKWRSTRIQPFSFRDNHHANAKQRKAIAKSTKHSVKSQSNRSYSNGTGTQFHDFGDQESDSSGDPSCADDEREDEGDATIRAILQNEKMSLERVKELLKKRHSIQRHRNSSWLMHAIIDAVVDNLVPISKIYEAQLQRMGTKLFELQHRLSRREVKEMIVMRRDLEWLQHELRPFARVIRHLIDDKNIGIEVTHYLEDVEDHLLRTVEELSSFASECVSLKDEYNAYLDRRMNDILYVLTIVTTLVVPAQFFTGYYGMNFENPDTGELGVPLLRMGSTGVACFWAIIAGCTLLTIFIMQKCHFFEKELE